MADLAESTGTLLGDLLKAREESAIEMQKSMGVAESDIQVDISNTSAIYLEAKLTRDAIVHFLTKSNFTITELKAPVILEDLKTPDLPVNVQLQTMMGEYGPLLDTLKTIAAIGGPAVVELVEELQSQIENAVRPLLEGGSTLPGLDLNKDNGALESTGYVVIGEDPESQGGFDVDDLDGQRDHTNVE